MGGRTAWIPDACTLPTVRRPFRVREFDRLFADALTAVDRVGPQRLRLSLVGGEPVAARTRDLTARESECCSFFTFSISTDGDRVELEIEVPATQVAVLDAMAARAARATSRK